MFKEFVITRFTRYVRAFGSWIVHFVQDDYHHRHDERSVAIQSCHNVSKSQDDRLDPHVALRALQDAEKTAINLIVVQNG